MDNVEKILSGIRSDSEIMRARFSANFLDTVAEVLERHGLGTARVFLLEKQGRTELRPQAAALLKVLDEIEKYPDVKANRGIGRLIIKTLITLKSTKGA